MTDPQFVIAQGLAALDGFAGDVNAATYQNDARELVERLEAAGWSLARHAPRAPAVEPSRSDLAARPAHSLPLVLARSGDGW